MTFPEQESFPPKDRPRHRRHRLVRRPRRAGPDQAWLEHPRLARDPTAAAAKLGPRTPIEWVRGDAMDAASVLAAAQGVQLVVHAPTRPAIATGRARCCRCPTTHGGGQGGRRRLVIPGNVYNFARTAAMIGEDAHSAPHRKGALRAEMERRLRAASEDGLKVLILRSGDFFGPAAPNSGFPG